MTPILLLGVGIGALALMSRKGGSALWGGSGRESESGYDSGEGPFDTFPSGVDRAAVVSVNAVTSSAGRKYVVREWKRSGGQVYYVAVRTDGSKDWVSYLFDPVGKQRVLHSANAETSEGIAALRTDFAL